MPSPSYFAFYCNNILDVTRFDFRSLISATWSRDSRSQRIRSVEDDRDVETGNAAMTKTSCFKIVFRAAQSVVSRVSDSCFFFFRFLNPRSVNCDRYFEERIIPEAHRARAAFLRSDTFPHRRHGYRGPHTIDTVLGASQILTLYKRATVIMRYPYTPLIESVLLIDLSITRSSYERGELKFAMKRRTSRDRRLYKKDLYS